jgi:RNA polymerase sigma-70 factor (ECF subfamily)
MARQGETPETEGALSESELVARLRAHDDQAFEQLVRTHGPRLLKVARRLVGNEEDARDTLQSAYLSAYRAIDRFDGRSLLSTWLHRIVVNTALMKLRTRERKPEQPIDDLLPRFLDDGHMVDPATSWSPPILETLERREAASAVRAAIDRLPESHRTVLMLRDIEELSTRDTAEILGISETAVKLRLHRARQSLATLLRNEHTPRARPKSRSN